MKPINTFLLIFLALLFIRCEKNENKGFFINGIINTGFNNYLYLQYNNRIDSIFVKDSVFNFKGNVEEPLEASFYPGSPTSKEIMMLAPFMLENSNIFISLNYRKRKFRGASIKSLQIDSINGSTSQELKNNFDSKMARTFYKEKNDSLKALLLYNNLYEFISTNSKFVLSGNYLAEKNNRYDYLTSKQIENLYKLLDTNYQNKRDLTYIKNIINRRRVLAYGNYPPKFVLPNQKNELVDSDSLKGNFVLIEFWASWCGPCREANPELIQVYNSFKDNGFEIIGVSQDKHIDKWKTAIKEDKIEWIQVIDSLNIVGDAYYLTTIPYNILVDKKGKIIARNLKPKILNKTLGKLIRKKYEITPTIICN